MKSDNYWEFYRITGNFLSEILELLGKLCLDFNGCVYIF